MTYPRLEGQAVAVLTFCRRHRIPTSQALHHVVEIIDTGVVLPIPDIIFIDLTAPGVEPFDNE